ncbi:hypothetical protein B5S29_g2610 [[Candida] boidinii]|nr:hypothetical protein B5S29_g2610 [[Candida] boidinii]
MSNELNIPDSSIRQDESEVGSYIDENQEINSFNPNIDDLEDGADDFDAILDANNRKEIGSLHETISRSVTQNRNDNVLTRLSTLSKSLSHLNVKQMTSFKIDPNDLDLKKVLNFMVNKNAEDGLSDRITNVMFQDVTVIGKNTSTSIVPNVGDIALSPFQLIKDKISKKEKDSRPKTREIVKNVTGLVKNGEMLLVLGRPGAGCSTLLKALSGEMQSYIGLKGDISFNGIPYKDMMKRFKNQIIYNPELDVHFPHLTVDQTLRFAIACRTPSVRIDNVSRSEYITTIRDLWATVFGLSHVYHTKVGNDFVRGISGGQRKRVSIAEAMVTRASVYCFDNATRGLDSSTALEFIETLRSATNITQATSLVTIYQAGETIYEAFDKVSILYLGRQIYFGPADKAKQYFLDMGFECRQRQSTPEFLTAVTDPLGRTARKGFENKVPNTADEFVEYWLNSKEYKYLLNEIQEVKSLEKPEETFDHFARIQKLEKMKYSAANSHYTINYFEQLKLCTLRGIQKILGNKDYSITLVAAAIIQSLIIGSLFYKTPSSTAGAFGKGGVVFFALFYFVIMGLAEIASIFLDKPILKKQKGYSFFHPSAELIANVITVLPVKIFAIACFSLILYFLADLKLDAGAFFIFFLFINLTVQTVNAIFVLLSSLVPTLSAANGITGLLMLCLLMYSSYLIQRPSMVPWFKWYSYMNPVLYGFESIITSQFHGIDMACAPASLIPVGEGYENVSDANRVCAFTGSMEHTYVNGDEYLLLVYGYKYWHVWRNFGILMCFLIGVFAINALIVEFYDPDQASGDQLLFIKGAKLPSALLDESKIKSKDIETYVDDQPHKEGSTSDISNNEKDVFDQRTTADASTSTGGKLGSNDIFMWQHVDYVIQYDGADRKLLDDVQGFVIPGTLTALMGESGAGKTTLLNVLSQRVDMGIVTGDMLVNGKPTDSSFKRSTGYVQQQDVHIAELTVRESLIFAARMRRPLSVPDSEKIEYVDKVMDLLQMTDYADAIAGQPGFGLNVEQRKKLSIATELVAKPTLLLFLDEPTSGLDSQSSWSIVQVMKELAKAGQAVLCTIHQPSATLFEVFDRLLLLRRGGQTVYFGDIGENSRTLIDYFEDQGARKCGSDENPAEYVLEAIGAGATANSDEDWNQKWVNSEQCAKVTKEVDDLIARTRELPATDNSEFSGTYATPHWYQAKYVILRTATQFYRDVDYILSKFMLLVVAGLLTGFSFWNVKHTVVGMQNLLFANFLAVTICAPLTNQIQGRAIESRELFEVRESKSNTFHWSHLIIAQFVSEMPYSILFSTFYFIAWYFPVQLDNAPAVSGFWWFTVCFFFQFYYVSLALWVIYMSPDLPSANVIVSLMFNFIMAFCGVMQPPDRMPGFWKFMWRASPFTYFIENIVGVLLHDRDVYCSAEELSYLQPPDGLTCGEYLNPFVEKNTGYIANPNDTANCGYCQYSVGDDYLAQVNIKFSNRWRNIGLFCVYIGFNVFAMIGSYYLFRVRGVSMKPPKALLKFIERLQKKK